MSWHRALLATVACVALGLGLGACGGGGEGPSCQTSLTSAYLERLDCQDEFGLVAARPSDTSLSGARTVKTIIDRADDNRLYFLDMASYPLHQTFASELLAWPQTLPFFNEYLAPSRRFLLGQVTYFQDSQRWTYELAPYDTASPEMITTAMAAISARTYFGEQLAFHATSEQQRARSVDLPADMDVVATEELFAGLSYHPLSRGVAIGQVRIVTAQQLQTTYVSPRDIVVLDQLPDDLLTVAAAVTAELPTPLSDVVVRAQQRGSPIIASQQVVDALADLEGQWVRLEAGAFDWTVSASTQGEADAWWDARRPSPLDLTTPDRSVTGLVNLDELDLTAIAAIGSRAAHVAELRTNSTLRARPGFVIPVAYYLDFLSRSGLDGFIDTMLAEPDFASDPTVRRARLDDLQQRIRNAAMDPSVLATIEGKLQADYAATRMRFYGSTNAEDIGGLSGNGLYRSQLGEAGSSSMPVNAAVKQVWASLWSVRAFEERSLFGVDQTRVAMALLVQPAYTDETASGVATTANIFDSSATGEDAFYMNVQPGQVGVAQPGAAELPDQLLYFYNYNNQPATYYNHSTLEAGQSVLSRRDLFQLGAALAAIRQQFASTYEPPPAFAALPMVVRFKRVGVGDASVIEIVHAAPYLSRRRTENGN